MTGKTLLAVPLMSLALIAACGRVPSGKGNDRAAPSLADVAATVPAPQGFRAQAKPGFFDQENLYKAIDGQAPEFISYGCEGLALIGWARPGNADQTVQAEIYDMGSPLGAYGIYSRAHTGEGDFLSIGGEEAAVAEDLVEFARQRFYVKLMGPPEARPALEALAKAIVALIPPGPRPEQLLAGLPREGRIARTDRWVPAAAFGLEFMRDVFTARYRAGQKEVGLHVAAFGDPAAARAALDKFRQAVSKQSPKPIESSWTGFQYDDQWLGSVAVFLVGHKLAVIVGYEKTPAVEQLVRQVAALDEH